MSTNDPLIPLREQVYRQRIIVDRLRREVFQFSGRMPDKAKLSELQTAEQALNRAEASLAAALSSDPNSGLLLDYSRGGPGGGFVLGAQTTGLEAKVYLRMAQVPTSIYHLFDPQKNPLLEVKVTNFSSETRRLRVISFIQGYSAQAVNSAEIASNKDETFFQLPTLFPADLAAVTELTRATLNVLVEDLDTGKVETHSTYPIWLLARTTAPLAVKDPKTGQVQDLMPYLGAFVTPNHPDLMHFLRAAAELHPQKRLVGYQGSPGVVEPQVKALFEALKQDARITYVNSVIDFTPDQGASNQRVRLPYESLKDGLANCIDGVVLLASLLEGVSLSPAIVIVPGHAFLAWETWTDNTAKWRFIETTMIGSNTFEEAVTQGEANAATYKTYAEGAKDPFAFRILPLRQLRAEYGITPMA
jgi:hypothetical protein